MSYFHETWNFSTDFLEIPNFMKRYLLEVELFHADGQTDRQTDRQKDRQTDKTKWIVANPNFADTPIHIPIFCYMMPCKLVYSSQIFRGFCSLNLQGRTCHPKRWYLYTKMHCVLNKKTEHLSTLLTQSQIFHIFKNLTVAELVKKKFHKLHNLNSITTLTKSCKFFLFWITCM